MIDLGPMEDPAYPDVAQVLAARNQHQKRSGTDAMKTDRELLEAAAKAAGIPGGWCEVHGMDLGQDACGIAVPPRRWGDKLWNPLGDDGDALRLAVKMELHVFGSRIGCNVNDDLFVDAADCGNDHYAATRRAIVCAAAAMAP